MIRLLLGLVLALGSTTSAAGQTPAFDLTGPICERLLYKASPDAEQYTMNVAGVLAPEPDDEGWPNYPFAAAEYIDLRSADESADDHAVLFVSDDYKRVVIEIRLDGHTFPVLDYIVGPRERPSVYANYVTHTIIGECLRQVGELVKGYFVNSLAVEYLIFWCNSGSTDTALCSPFFLSREMAFALSMANDSRKNSDSIAILGEKLTGNSMKRVFVLLYTMNPVSYSEDLVPKDPCSILSAYIGDAACFKLIEDGIVWAD